MPGRRMEKKNHDKRVVDMACLHQERKENKITKEREKQKKKREIQTAEKTSVTITAHQALVRTQ